TLSVASVGVVGLVAGMVDELGALYSPDARSVQSADCSSTSPTSDVPSGFRLIVRIRMSFDTQPSSSKFTATISPVAAFLNLGPSLPLIAIWLRDWRSMNSALRWASYSLVQAGCSISSAISSAPSALL